MATYGEIVAHLAYYMFSKYMHKCLIINLGFFPPRFWDWEFSFLLRLLMAILTAIFISHVHACKIDVTAISCQHDM